MPDLSKNAIHLTTERKALLLNIDKGIYGTFAEIGAGQEVARHFFTAGGAAGTIAKSMSAYDMKFSDAIYGKAQRYVSRERLLQMLDHEYDLLTKRLAKDRGKDSTFFVFANTVAAASYRKNQNCHGWMGIRYQIAPNSKPNDIIAHVHMWDTTPIRQQESIGIFGVNFIWAAFVSYKELDQFIPSLVDQLDTKRIEVDVLKFSGPDLSHIENHVVCLKLVENQLTNAVMFGPKGSIVQPSEILYKKCILVERGSFKPITYLHLDMMRCASSQFTQEASVKDEEVVRLIEMTTKDLLGNNKEIDYNDFLARIRCVSEMGYKVLVSNYYRYYRLSAYFRRYTDKMVGMVIGISHLQAIFETEYYEDLEGGILEAFGRLFKNSVKLYVYPMFAGEIKKHAKFLNKIFSIENLSDNAIVTSDSLTTDHFLRHLYNYLLESKSIISLTGANQKYLKTYTKDILDKISSNDQNWEEYMPGPVVTVIRENKLWGCR